MATKTVNLRAFEIINNDFNRSESDICNRLKKKLLESGSVNERRMLLNKDDPQQEQDLIPSFEISENEKMPIFCTMLRVVLGNNIQHINDELFKKQNFSISELKHSKVDGDAIYRNHCYFALNNNFLVTNLGRNFTVSRLQTYLNWFLQDLFEINPLVSNNVVQNLKNIKSIVIKDNGIYRNNEDDNNKESKNIIIDICNFSRDIFRSLFLDVNSFSDIELAQMVSARLVLEIKKPQKSDTTSLMRAYGAALKPIADLENIEIETRDKKKISKEKRLDRIKSVDIEVTNSSMLNENQLLQEMNKFIYELENEKTNM